MDPTNPYRPPDAPLPAVPEPLPVTPGRVAGIGLLTLLGTVFAYIVGQGLALLNLPLALILTSLFVFGAAGLVFPAAWNLRPALFAGLDRFPSRLVLLSFAIGLANFAFANFLMGIAQNVLPESWSEDAKNLTRMLAGAKGAAAGLIVLAAGLAAPVGEELFFRGWLQGLWIQRFRAISSVVVVAIVFSAIHFDAVGFVARVELGLLFGLMRLWSGSLWPAITLHATHNTLSLAVMYLSPDPLAELDQPFPWKESAIFAAISLAGTVALLRIARRWGTPEPVVELAPLNPDLPPLQLEPMGALRVAAPLAALATAFTAVIVFAGPKLPGAHMISLPARPPDFPVAPEIENGSTGQE